MKRGLKIIAITLAALGGWTAIAVFGAFSGWWMTALAPAEDRDAFVDAITRMVDESTLGNAAVVIVEEGTIVFEKFTANPDPIDRNTLFPTASFSKFVTAIAVMQLVERGLVDLDVPVSSYLSRWSLPTGTYDPVNVTVRRLLSHTAGLSDGLGFGDYAADETLPRLEDELASPRASSGERVDISVVNEPGVEFQYSGGGFLVLELVVEEVSGDTFEHYVTKNIFEPLGMARSNYQFIGSLDNIARSYDRDGNAVPMYQYASSAATGLNSSAADLARLAQALLPGSGADYLLMPASIALMRQPHASAFGIDIWGLGSILYAPTQNGDVVFGHDGANDPAINSALRLNPDTGDAIIALSNGHPSLATTLGFEWVLWQTGYPDPLNTVRIIQSLWVPLGSGSFLILLVSVLVWRRSGPLRLDSAGAG